MNVKKGVSDFVSYFSTSGKRENSSMAFYKGGELATERAAFKMENVLGFGSEVFETIGIKENMSSIIGIRYKFDKG